MEKEEKKSLIALIISMLIFGSTGIFRSMIIFSSAFVSFCRGISGSLLVALFCLITGKKLRNNIEKKKLLLTVLSGACVGINWMLVFESISLTSVPVAIMLNYMQPTIVIFLAPLFLKETVSQKSMICAIFAVFGMTLVSGLLPYGSLEGASGRGVLYGLLSAFFYAFVVIINRKISDVDNYERTFIQLLSAGLVMLPYLLLTGEFEQPPADERSIIFLIIACVVNTCFAYLLLFKAYANLKAQTSALLSYIDPISNLILAAIVLGEELTVFGLIGAILILGATFVSEIDFKKNIKSKTA